MNNRQPQDDATDFTANDVRPDVQTAIRAINSKEIVKSKFFTDPLDLCLDKIKSVIPCGADEVWTEKNFKAFCASTLDAIRGRLIILPLNSVVAATLEESERYLQWMLRDVRPHIPIGVDPDARDGIIKAFAEKRELLSDYFRSVYADEQVKGEVSTEKALNPTDKKTGKSAHLEDSDKETTEESDGDAEEGVTSDAPKAADEKKRDEGYHLLASRLIHFSFFEEDDGIPLAFRTKINFASHTTRMRDSVSKDQAQFQIESGRCGLPAHLIGTHSADMIFDADSVGKGQITFVAMFWAGQKIRGKSVIQWVREGNDEIIAAIVNPFGTANARESNRIEEYRQIAANFFGVTCASSVEKKGDEVKVGEAGLGSVAPQVYWLTKSRGEARNDGLNGRENDFTLIAPIPPLSLSIDITTKLELMQRAGHFLFRDIADVSSARYTPNAEKWKVSATRGYLKSEIGYCRVGGSKPQNVSSLSSINGTFGFAYLPSLPPRLPQEQIIPRILHFSAIRFFLQRSEIKDLIARRARILGNPTGKFYSAVKTHTSGYESRILDAVFEAWERYTSGYEPGWSAGEGFENLPLDEAMWLDPMRSACELPEGVTDQAFADLARDDAWSRNLERRLGIALAKATWEQTIGEDQTPLRHLEPDWIDTDAKRWMKNLRFPKPIRIKGANSLLDSTSSQD